MVLSVGSNLGESVTASGCRAESLRFMDYSLVMGSFLGKRLFDPSDGLVL